MISGASTGSSIDGVHPASKPGHHDGRWMVTRRRLSARVLNTPDEPCRPDAACHPHAIPQPRRDSRVETGVAVATGPDLNTELIGELWGAYHTMPDWEVNNGLTAATGDRHGSPIQHPRSR